MLHLLFFIYLTQASNITIYELFVKVDDRVYYLDQSIKVIFWANQLKQNNMNYLKDYFLSSNKELLNELYLNAFNTIKKLLCFEINLLIQNKSNYQSFIYDNRINSIFITIKNHECYIDDNLLLDFKNIDLITYFKYTISSLFAV